MKVTGINEVHADSRDVITEILASGFEKKVSEAILKTESAATMGIKKVIIEKVEIFGTQYPDGDPVATFWVTIKRPAKKYDMNRAVYKVYIVGGKRATGDAAYFEKDEYVA